MDLIDSHCHLEKFKAKGTLSEVLRNAQEAGVSRLITVGTSIEDWATYCELAKAYPEQIAWTVGIHPCDVAEDWEDQAMAITPWFTDDVPPVALGEIGLDYFHLPKAPDEAAEIKQMQREAFAHQLTIAYQLDCPVVVHSRHAFDDCVAMIDKSGVDWKNVVFHCFAEGAEQMAILNERGGRGSFTGIITYKNAETVREAALKQGLERIMIETDAPYLSPVPHRGKPCEPAYTRLTAEYCAQLFEVSLDEFTAIATRNTEAFYRL